MWERFTEKWIPTANSFVQEKYPDTPPFNVQTLAPLTANNGLCTVNIISQRCEKS